MSPSRRKRPDKRTRLARKQLRKVKKLSYPIPESGSKTLNNKNYIYSATSKVKYTICEIIP